MRLSFPVGLLLLLCACAGGEDRRFDVCQALLPAFLAQGERAEVLDRSVSPDDPRRIQIEFARRAPFLAGRETLTCTFAGDGRGGRLGLIAIEKTGSGPLSDVKLQLLRRELSRELTESSLRATNVELAVRLPEFRLPLRDLGSIRAGGVLSTGIPRDAQLEVFVSGQHRFTGSPGRVGGNLAVRVAEVHHVDEEPVAGAQPAASEPPAG